MDKSGQEEHIPSPYSAGDKLCVTTHTALRNRRGFDTCPGSLLALWWGKKIRGEMASESRSLAPRETGKQSISRKKKKKEENSQNKLIRQVSVRSTKKERG